MLRFAFLLSTTTTAMGGPWDGLPSWEPTYEMWRSTAFMPCNYSGFFDPSYAAKWGLVDFDWSNGKKDWANQKPMDCQERLVAQVEKIKALNNETRVFVYRNIVKALPWYTDVRQKLSDPAYSGWFLKFKDGINGSYHVPACTAGKCSEFYHDQDQTPKHPHGDGSCVDECDCGPVPCGEYLFDHRNDTLRKWLVDEFIMGSTGLGHPMIEGFYFDDGWSDKPDKALAWWPKEGYCSADVIGGPTEEYPNCTVDMGLTQADTTSIKKGWMDTLSVIADTVVAAGGFTWQMLHTVQGAPKPDTCAAYFRRACSASSQEQQSALLLEFTNPKSLPLTAVTEDLATFLLVRGPYAWIGYSWIGCAWGDAESVYPRPMELDMDYGSPIGLCEETAEGSAIFQRTWSKAKVSFDCNTWEASIDTLGDTLVA